MIIIPDIHGRTFWKDAVEQKQESEEVIFLGDYLDPYRGEIDPDNENRIITKTSSIENFREILEYKKHNPKDTILLLGNHDTEYFLGTTPCREDLQGWDKIQAMFEKNLNLFEVASYRVTPSITYTFSHSGIIKAWTELCLGKEYEDLIEVIDKLNCLLHGNDSDRVTLGKYLDMIGWSRGGDYQNGSLVWADVFELPNHEWPGVFQIFGHTQQREYPIHDETYSMLDCRLAFRLNTEAKSIHPLPNRRTLLNASNIKAYARKEIQI